MRGQGLTPKPLDKKNSLLGEEKIRHHMKDFLQQLRLTKHFYYNTDRSEIDDYQDDDKAGRDYGNLVGDAAKLPASIKVEIGEY